MQHNNTKYTITHMHNADARNVLLVSHSNHVIIYLYMPDSFPSSLLSYFTKKI